MPDFSPKKHGRRSLGFFSKTSILKKTEKTQSLGYVSFRQNRLNLLLSRFRLGPEPTVASVSVDDVRDVVNVSSAEGPDAKVLKMIKRTEVTLELETDREIANCVYRSRTMMNSSVYIPSFSL